MAELLVCWREADRADDIAAALFRIQTDVDALLVNEVAEVTRQIQFSSRLLRDLFDLYPIYNERVPYLLDYLSTLLPCFRRTLQDIWQHLGDYPDFTFERIWIDIDDHLRTQCDVSLRERFTLYNDLLVQLVRLLSRPSMYNAGALESLWIRILRLRIGRGFPVPRAPPPPPPAAMMALADRPHWAEKVFENRHSSTRLKHQRNSRCFGRPMPSLALGIPSESKVLFKLPFDRNALSVSACLLPQLDDLTRLLCRWGDRDGVPAYSSYGVHELCIKRRGASLLFDRLSLQTGHPKVWLALFFKTWEKMVIFHDTFVALKSRCPLTIACSPDDFLLGGERKLFQERILDDNFNHVLTIYEDKSTSGLRLHATVREGVLKRTPVWTTFVTEESVHPNWLQRHSRKRIWLRQVRLHIFCSEYKERTQRKSGKEFFELCFLTEQAANRFEDVFRLPEKNGQPPRGVHWPDS